MGAWSPKAAPGPSRRSKTAWHSTGPGAIRSRPQRTKHGNASAGRASKTSRRPELLARVFAQRTGRNDPTPQDLADVNEDLHQGPEDFIDGRHFSERVRHFYAQAQARFADRSLEVGRCLPDTRDLVISDNPVVTPSHRKPGLNAQQGVALGDAHAVGMPLGPRLFVSLTDRPDAATIGDAQAAVLNDWQASVRRTHLIRRPPGERR